MPLLTKVVCDSCGYRADPMVSAPWQQPTFCCSCHNVALARRDPFQKLAREWHCVSCSAEVARLDKPALDELGCPVCQARLRWDCGIVRSGPIPRPQPGQTVHFRRLGYQEEAVLGEVAFLGATLVGKLTEQPGVWWGEGRVREVEPLIVTVSDRRPERATSEASRLEISWPISREPWLAVDLNQLYSRMEREARWFSLVESTWGVNSASVDSDGVARVEASAGDASGFFSLLMTGDSCLAQLHDGQEWLDFQGLHLVVRYSGERAVVVHANGTVMGDVEDEFSYHTPFWVDVMQGEERRVRWGQPRMLKRWVR